MPENFSVTEQAENKQQSVTVSLGDRSYAIKIATGNTSEIAKSIIAATDLSHAIIFSDAAVGPIASALVNDLHGGDPETSNIDSVRCSHLVVPSGETSKSITPVR